jgi:hypothetical protein
VALRSKVARIAVNIEANSIGGSLKAATPSAARIFNKRGRTIGMIGTTGTDQVRRMTVVMIAPIGLVGLSVDQPRWTAGDGGKRSIRIEPARRPRLAAASTGEF